MIYLITSTNRHIVDHHESNLDLNEENSVTSLKDEEFFTLQECELEASYQWYFYAILSSLEIPFVSPTILGISKFLGLDLEIVQKAVLTLIKMGAIKYKDDKLF